MLDSGLKISLPGYDASIAKPEQFALHSSYPNPKVALGKNPAHISVIAHNHVNEPIVGETTILTRPHGLTYRPFVVVHFEQDLTSSAGVIRDGILPYLQGLGGSDWHYAYSDDVNIYIKFHRDTLTANGVYPGSPTILMRYYIFAENGA